MWQFLTWTELVRMQGRNPFALLFRGFIVAGALLIGGAFMMLCVAVMIGWLD